MDRFSFTSPLHPNQACGETDLLFSLPIKRNWQETPGCGKVLGEDHTVVQHGFNFAI